MNHIHPIIKSIAVTIIATLIAYFLGLTYYLSAGIIAIISIQKTKKLSLTIAFKRSILVVISLLVSNVMFVLLGHNLYAYFLFIIFIIVISYVLNLKEGTIPSIVIVTQLLIYPTFSIEFTLETLLLYVISISTSLLFNVFYPSESMIKLDKLRNELDDTLKKQVLTIKDNITNHVTSCSRTLELEKQIEKTLNRINQITGDLIMRNHQELLMYSNMRNKQFDILKNICSHSEKLNNHYPQTDIMEDYLNKLSLDIGVKNLAQQHLNEVESMLSKFKNDQLPITRDEFEHRAELYYMMQEIKQFLVLKVNYHKHYSY